MKKNLIKITLMLGLMILLSMSFYISNAAEASLIANNVTVGDTIKVIIRMPPEAVGYSGEGVDIIYSDGTTVSSGKFCRSAQTNGMTAKYEDYTNEFPAKVPGNAIIRVRGLKITDGKIRLNNNTQLEIVVNIAEKPVIPPAPVEPPPEENKPADNTKPAENNKPAKQPKVLNFKDVNETVYTTKNVNLRQSYGTDKRKIKTLTSGVELQRTGVSTDKDENGRYWSRVTYKGSTAYLITSALTTQKPAPKEEPKKEEKTQEVKEELPEENINQDELALIKEKIGVIPEVGNNIMISVFASLVIVSLGMVFILKRKNK